MLCCDTNTKIRYRPTKLRPYNDTQYAYPESPPFLLSFLHWWSWMGVGDDDVLEGVRDLLLTFALHGGCL
jgi:hypothetical protein